MPFLNRVDAGRKLARALAHYEMSRPVVFALLRGGVPVAVEVADSLHAPLDLLLVRTIGMPTQPEVAMGAVVDGAEPVVLRYEDIVRYARISSGDFRAIADAELAEIERCRTRYLRGRSRVDPAGRVVIVVDDGIATGVTVRTSLRAIRRRHPGKLVVAVPLGPLSTIEQLRREVDDVICLEVHEHLGSVGQYYADFRPTSDDEVKSALARCPVRHDRSMGTEPRLRNPICDGTDGAMGAEAIKGEDGVPGTCRG